MQETNGLATDPSETEDRFVDQRNAKPWLQAIEDAEKYFSEYQSICDKIDKWYGQAKRLNAARTDREFQIFWANIEVIKPAIYARSPTPVVTARFKDRKPLVRHASEILERTLITSFDVDNIDSALRLVRDDVATYARGVTWLRYENDGKKERISYDHLDRRDFLHEPARKWREVGWVARRSYLSVEQMRARFEEISGGAYLDATYEERKEDNEEYDREKKAVVWEIWSKDRNVVIWVTPNVNEVLDITEPFLELDGFYPCPKPAYASCELGTLKPIPDYLYYKDQIDEVNELTSRISALSEGLRLKGFYSGGAEDIADAIETAIRSQDNNAILIPVPNTAALSGSGSSIVEWMPIREVADTIFNCVSLRQQLINDIYEITGISDIMRGTTQASETLGAQQLKSQFGATRIRDRQDELARIARDSTRIAGEIMAENFSPETLLSMSQYDELPRQEQIAQQSQQIQSQIAQAQSDPNIQQQAQQNPEQAQQLLQQAQQQLRDLQQQVTFEQVYQFLQDQRMRPFVLDIETDSTIQPDEDAQKKLSNEFLTALSNALSQLGPLIEARPETSEFAGEALKFAVAPYRAGRVLAASIDNLVDQIKNSSAKDKENPAQQQAQAEMQMKQQEMQLQAQIKQAEIKMKQAEMQAQSEQMQREMELKFQETQDEMLINREKAAAEIEKIKAETEKLYAEVASVNFAHKAEVVV